ncbi:MAG: PP2C family protein-serine/threonine phosphatase, partial [Kibdelosporangium sp.]
RFCTVLFGFLTLDDGIGVSFASGGHPPPLLLTAGGAVESLDTPGGQLVGALQHAQFKGRSARIEPGDTLLMYTDGLSEARTRTQRNRWGEEALQAFVATITPTTAAGAVAAIADLLTGFGDRLDDDTAVLALSVPEVSG